MEDEQSTSPSLKNKLKQSLCLSCCFSAANRRETPDSPSSSSDDRPRLLRASSTWLRSRAHELPEIKDKCRYLIGRIGGHRRRQTSSADFSYDPLSYSLNFDEDSPRKFSTRETVSPPLKTVPEVEDLVNPAVTRGMVRV